MQILGQIPELLNNLRQLSIGEEHAMLQLFWMKRLDMASKSQLPTVISFVDVNCTVQEKVFWFH